MGVPITAANQYGSGDSISVNALHRASPIRPKPKLSPNIFVSMPYIGLLPFLRYPSKTNDFPACSNPKFAYVFEKGRFFILFRLIFGFLKIFTILFSIL